MPGRKTRDKLVCLRAVSSMVEHLVYTEGVRSSSLLPPKAFGDRGFDGTTLGLLCDYKF